MAQQILIDMQKFRGDADRPADRTPAEGIIPGMPEGEGMKGIRELAAFKYACRRCAEAPCVEVCPADALEKDPGGTVMRSVNLCISCKSCVVICPFGTLMTDFFSYHRQKDKYYNLLDDNDLELFIQSAPEGSVTWVDMDEDPKQDIYRLHERILVREKAWSKEPL